MYAWCERPGRESVDRDTDRSPFTCATIPGKYSPILTIQPLQSVHGVERCSTNLTSCALGKVSIRSPDLSRNILLLRL